MLEIVETIVSALASQRFPLDTEAALQVAIEQRFSELSIDYSREHRLGAKQRPDFFIEGVVVEVKIKGGARAIYKQCADYCAFPDVKALVLVTNRAMGFPEDIDSTPCYVINLGRAWL